MDYKNLPRIKSKKVIHQFLGLSKDMRALWLSSMAFALLVTKISANEDEDENLDAVERKYLEMTGFALGLPKADVLATIEYMQDSKNQCQN